MSSTKWITKKSWHELTNTVSTIHSSLYLFARGYGYWPFLVLSPLSTPGISTCMCLTQCASTPTYAKARRTRAHGFRPGAEDVRRHSCHP